MSIQCPAYDSNHLAACRTCKWTGTGPSEQCLREANAGKEIAGRSKQYMLTNGKQQLEVLWFTPEELEKAQLDAEDGTWWEVYA